MCKTVFVDTLSDGSRIYPYGKAMRRQTIEQAVRNIVFGGKWGPFAGVSSYWMYEIYGHAIVTEYRCIMGEV